MESSEDSCPSLVMGGGLVDIKDASKPFFSYCNLLPHAMIKSVNVRVNSKTITLGDEHYMLRAYMQNLVNSNKATLDTYLASSGWVKDQGDWDSIDPKRIQHFRPATIA